jgi:hypothetical protein
MIAVMGSPPSRAMDGFGVDHIRTTGSFQKTKECG